MTLALFRKDLASLRPADRAATETLARIKAGEMVAVEIRRPRNLKHHRWWWKLMELVADNMPGAITPELVCEVIKVRVGHVSVVRTRQGEVFIPRSISFAKMDEAQFSEFTDRAIRVIVTDILPGLSDTALRAEVEAMLSGSK